MKIHSAMLAAAVLAGTLQVEFGGASHAVAAEQKSTPVMVQDFEKATPQPSVWVVNIPNENASVQLSTDQPHDGKQCLKLHYHFLGTGSFQYLGIPNKVKIQAPVHKLHYWLKGDGSKCSYGLQVTDASGETHQYRSLSSGTGQGGIVDFTGWKEVVFDLDAPHETWGGDKNGKLDHPITAIILTVGQPMEKAGGKEKPLPAEGDLYFDSLSVDSEKSVAETLGCQVAVVSPAYCSDVQGDTPVTLAAPGFKSVTVKCWKQGGVFGSDSTVATVALDAKGNGSFVFPANAYPHGPITVRISGADRRRQGQLLPAALQQGRRFLERRDAQGSAPGGQRHVAGLCRRLHGPAVDIRHRSQGHLLRPQAAQRLAGLQRTHVHEPRFPEEPLCPGRFLPADQGQRQDTQLPA